MLYIKITLQISNTECKKWAVLLFGTNVSWISTHQSSKKEKFLTKNYKTLSILFSKILFLRRIYSNVSLILSVNLRFSGIQMFLSGASLTSPALALVSEPTGISPSRSPLGSAPGSTHPGYGEIVPLYPGFPGTSSLYFPDYPGLEHSPFKYFLFIRSPLLITRSWSNWESILFKLRVSSNKFKYFTFSISCLRVSNFYTTGVFLTVCKHSYHWPLIVL